MQSVPREHVCTGGGLPRMLTVPRATLHEYQTGSDVMRCRPNAKSNLCPDTVTDAVANLLAHTAAHIIPDALV